MNLLKSTLMAGGASLALVVAAQAADLPTTKGPPPAPASNCFQTFWTWLDSTPADCPLSLYGFTFYGAIDVGAGYASAGSRFNPDHVYGITDFIQNTSKGGRWQVVPGGLGASNFGLKWKEQVAPDWFIVGDVNAGFDPYSLRFLNGPKSLEDNNTLPVYLRSADSDSSRAYGLINNKANGGISNSTFGTLTFGRHTTFANDSTTTYDPFGGAYAFSLIGGQASYVQGTGLTEMARYTDSVKYVWSNDYFRVGGMAGLGGYDAGNNAQQLYEFDVGGDWNGFSSDVIYQYGRGVVNLTVWGSTPPAALAPDTLKATLQDVSAIEWAGKYKFDKIPLTLYGGYEFSDITASSAKPTGFVGDFNDGDPAQIQSSSAAYPAAKHLQVAWIGERYGLLSNLDLDTGWYHVWQNNYTHSAAPGYCAPNTTSPGGGASPQGSAHAQCAGTFDVVSGMLDYRPVKRVDIYGGVAYSIVSGGLANGFQKSVDLAETVGIRVSW